MYFSLISVLLMCLHVSSGKASINSSRCLLVKYMWMMLLFIHHGERCYCLWMKLLILEATGRINKVIVPREVEMFKPQETGIIRQTVAQASGLPWNLSFCDSSVLTRFWGVAVVFRPTFNCDLYHCNRQTCTYNGPLCMLIREIWRKESLFLWSSEAVLH